MAYTTIKKPSDYFNTVLYSGNGSYGNSITGVGFQPDWVWIKSRNNVYSHQLYDAVRGVDKKLQTDLSDAEATGINLLHSFDSDGFTVDDDNSINNGSTTYASWNWLGANGTASNTQGDIASTVSANTTSGFSIVSYTGTGANATVGHGLGTTPAMVIVKNRSEAFAWNCYHQSLGATKYILLNATDASATGTTWNNTAPTSSVFSIGSTSGVNKNTNNLIAYCFAEKKGFSKFGSYTGLGGTNYPFIYTGFKPAFIMAKRTDATSNWVMYDNKRQYNLIEGQYNPQRPRLASNLSNAESSFTTDNGVDLLSNGFVVRDNSNDAYTINISGATYIYMAFAEEPLVGDNPCTAR